MCVRGKTEVLKYSEEVVKYDNGLKKLYIPLVMKLIKFIRSIFRTHVPFSKKNIIIRDRNQCVYCGAKGDKSNHLTVDHILPISRGGKSTFENCVASCFSCNNKKSKKTPTEAGMFISRKPYCPTISEFLKLKIEQLGLENTLRDFGII
jgi:5-methylcytosine-specific restriction endonuclease McrA